MRRCAHLASACAWGRAALGDVGVGGCSFSAGGAHQLTPCSAAAGGAQTRSVTCTAALTGQPAVDSQCAAAKPATQQLCSPQPCDFCAGNACFGHGSCASGACTCTPGANFTGSYCQVPVGCQSGVPDAQLQCCASGLVGAGGGCCPVGAVLDAAGACCASGTLDACGVCDGSAKYVDVAGACCGTLLDADGLCCQVGVGMWVPLVAVVGRCGGVEAGGCELLHLPA